MSLLPLLLSELEGHRHRPLHHGYLARVHPDDLFDQHFGNALLRDDLLSPALSAVAAPLLSTHYLRPWRHQHHQLSGISHLKDDKDGLKINLDVQQFKPDELSVKVVDGCVVVKGKHEERQDEHGFIQRQFTRRYKLPPNVDPDAVTSNLSSDGVLMVSAPKKCLPENKNERSVPITHTQAPAVKHKDESKANGDAKSEQ